ncbi:MAG: L,D-transpeptidase family protein [Verrucomicrobia bacterium]|nr:L,D-transpeptidase family protein [Verrucomicrobiota bacterium]
MAIGTLVVVLIVIALFFLTRGCEKKPDIGEPANSSAVELTESAPAEPEITEDRSSAPDPGLRLLAQAKTSRSAQNLQEARRLCYEILDQSKNPQARKIAEDLLGDIHIMLVTTPRPMPEKKDYTIRPGDTLSEIASKFKTTIELVRKSNNISGSLIRVGDRLRVFSGDFAVVVKKSDNTLELSLNNRFFKRYRVGTGKFLKTPTGDFKITDRIVQPTWWRPDGKEVPYGSTNNVLGTHWLSLNIRGYGLHGTWEPETIGTHASAGCVRLLNSDIEELYMLLPLGTPVQIIE